MRIEVDIRKTLRSGSQAFRLDVSFVCEDDLNVIFGASGAGKSVTLKALAGIEQPDEGRIAVDGRVLFDSLRFAQTGNWSGQLRVADETFEVTPDRWKGSRDRSWGIRPVGAPDAQPHAPAQSPQA